MQTASGLDQPYDVIVASPNAALDSYYLLGQLNLGNVNRAEKVIHTAGGKGNNLARAVIALGGRAFSLGVLGGYTGKFVSQELEREKIPGDVVWCENETRRTSTLIQADQMQTTVILDSGSGIDLETGARFIGLVRSYAHQAPFLVLTGSLPRGLPADYYSNIVQAVRSNPGLKICVDCAGESLRLAVEYGAQVIKVNSKEFQTSYTSDHAWKISDAIEVYHRLKERGLELLIITDGPQGAYIFSGSQPPFRVITSVSRWVNTAGAGDTFTAGLLVGLQRGLALSEATRLASAAAAAKLQQIICGSLCMEDLDKFLPLTRVEVLALPGN